MKEEELVLYMKNHSNKEAAAHFGVSTSTIERRLRRLGLRYYDLKYGNLPTELNDAQKEIITGTLLGDATINGKCYYYAFTQHLSKQDYVDHIANALSPFTISCKQIHRSDQSLSYHMRTITSHIFKDLRSLWYKDKKKRIPREIVITPRTLAHWYCDDGYLLAKRKRIELATNGFSVEEIDMLAFFLRRDLAIKAGVHRDHGRRPILRVHPRSFFDFIEVVKPYVIWKSLAYKLDTSETPKTREGWGANKLSKEQVAEIRRLYDTDLYSQRCLAKMFGVSIRNINLIVNNKIHVIKNTLGFSGGAEYRLILPYNGS